MRRQFIRRFSVDRLLLLASSLLLIGGGLAATVVTLDSPPDEPPPGSGALFQPPTPSEPPQQPAEPSTTAPVTLEPTPGTPQCAAHVHYLNLTSKHKHNKGDFGDPIRVSGRYDVINAMRDYVYTDPAGAAVLTASFDPDADLTKINDRVRNYVNDHHNWCQEVDAMLDTALGAGFSLEGVDSGTRTFIMEKTTSKSIPVIVEPGTTATVGAAAVFTFYGHTVKLRLDCHFQPVEVANPPIPLS